MFFLTCLNTWSQLARERVLMLCFSSRLTGWIRPSNNVRTAMDRVAGAALVAVCFYQSTLLWVNNIEKLVGNNLIYTCWVHMGLNVRYHGTHSWGISWNDDKPKQAQASKRSVRGSRKPGPSWFGGTRGTLGTLSTIPHHNISKYNSSVKIDTIYSIRSIINLESRYQLYNLPFLFRKIYMIHHYSVISSNLHLTPPGPPPWALQCPASPFRAVRRRSWARRASAASPRRCTRPATAGCIAGPARWIR